MQLEENEKQARELIELIETILDPENWGFNYSFSRLTAEYPPSIIYDSEWCRVMFSAQGWDTYTGNTLAVYYGRLHAANESFKMIWHEEECRCWHDVKLALNFMDGLSPQEAVDQMMLHQQEPRIIQSFKQSETGKDLFSHQHFEWQVRLQALIWQHYGQQLFEIFDVRQPVLWDQFVSYSRTYLKIRGYSPYPRSQGEDQFC